MPRNICTARSVFYHVLKGHGSGLDVNGNYINWEILQRPDLAIAPNQPVMRSAHNVWLIPTVFVANQSFFYKKKKDKKTVSLQELFRRYSGVCQICYNAKPLSEFSREHIFPRAKGGTDDPENITLTCKQCNSNKSDIYPYYNIHGHILKPKNFGVPFYMPAEKEIRDEWLPFLFLEDEKSLIKKENPATD